MTTRVNRDGLQVDDRLAGFIETQALPGTGVTPSAFWNGFSALIHDLGPRNRALLARREELQARIDAWHVAHRRQPHDAAAYRAFLTDIGYLVPEGPDFTIETAATDPEFATISGPQLVVPIMNARYALNAANARWGSLYDALYGTGALGDLPPAGGYDAARGARVIAWGRRFLDESVPLASGSWADATGFAVRDGRLLVQTPGGESGLAGAEKFAGHAGAAAQPTQIVLKNNGLHIIVVIDPSNRIGRDDAAHVADIRLESAISSIMDCEDSVAAVDAEDKVLAYANWLGLM